ncbi:S58 family peptidase [archaeon]|nr:MAG: S58 family peptidase [archaeon]
METKRPGPREIGLTIGSLPTGENNNITDVAGVLVGHATVVEGEGKLVPREGPIRTGVTAVLPHDGNIFKESVLGGTFVLNGVGGLYGSVQLNELGIIMTPIMITNTLSIGKVADATVAYVLENNPMIGISEETVIPIVCECDDSFLNDIRGLHVTEEHVFAAISNAKGGAIEEGNVGAGTGMATFDFKGGIGSSSRVTPEGYAVGVLVCSNFGDREEMVIDGVPVGRELRDWQPKPPEHNTPGSIVIVVATDAPLSNRQLNRLAKRAAIGLARTGTISSNGSGDIITSFSTANRIVYNSKEPEFTVRALSDCHINPLFQAAVEAAEEAVLNALFKAETMEGRDGNTLYALPLERTTEILRRYHRLA